MIWRNHTLVVVDCETTGIDVATSRVIEVAAVAFVGGNETQCGAWIVNPTIPIPAESTAVHGIGDLDVKHAPTFPDVAIELVAFLEDLPLPCVFAGYNARFDRAQLLAEFFRAGLESPSFLTGGDRRGWLDVLTWARAHDPVKGKERFKLGNVAARLGVEVDAAHRAADDARTAGRVLFAIDAKGLHPSARLDRIPDDWEDLQIHQRRLAAEHDAELFEYIARRRLENEPNG